MELRPEKMGIVAPKSDNVRLRLCMPRFVFAPICSGERVGWAETEGGGERIAIFCSEAVEVDEDMRLSVWERLTPN